MQLQEWPCLPAFQRSTKSLGTCWSLVSWIKWLRQQTLIWDQGANKTRLVTAFFWLFYIDALLFHPLWIKWGHDLILPKSLLLDAMHLKLVTSSWSLWLAYIYILHFSPLQKRPRGSLVVVKIQVCCQTRHLYHSLTLALDSCRASNTGHRVLCSYGTQDQNIPTLIQSNFIMN